MKTPPPLDTSKDWLPPFVVQASACLVTSRPSEGFEQRSDLRLRDSVLDCASPLALCNVPESTQSARGLAQSKTWRTLEWFRENCLGRSATPWAHEPSQGRLKPGLQTRRSTENCRAFSLLEMMLVVTMLTMIVYMLYAVFDQIQRALRSNTSQVDVMETGRATLDLVSRDLQGVEKSGMVNPVWMIPILPPTARLEESRPNLLVQLGYDASPKQLSMRLVDGTSWANMLQDCFFLTRSNNIWVATAYMVGGLTNDPKLPASLIFTTNQVDLARIGALVRVTATTTNTMARHQLRAADLDDMMLNLFRVKQGRTLSTNANVSPPALMADGIVHFRLRSLDLNGRPITNTWPDLTARIDRRWVGGNLVENYALFTSNSLPAYLDMELGILDPAVFQRLKAIPPSSAQRQFLTNQAGAVQLFHKLIPVRSVQRLPQP